MSTQRAEATRPAKARKYREPVKHVARGNVFDRVQKALERSEQETIRTKRSIQRSVEEFN